MNDDFKSVFSKGLRVEVMADNPTRMIVSYDVPDRTRPAPPEKYDHRMDYGWLLKASRRAVEDERARNGLRSFMSFAQSSAALHERELFRVRLKPTVRWRWGVNYAKAAGLSAAAAIYGSAAIMGKRRRV